MSHVFAILLTVLAFVIVPGWLGYRDASVWLLLAYAVGYGLWSSWRMAKKGKFGGDRNAFMGGVVLTVLACQPAYWLAKLL